MRRGRTNYTFDCLTLLRGLERGKSKAQVKYGGVCQLQHVKSGLFVCARPEAAPFDPECRCVTLSAGSVSSYFRVMPRYKAQTEGSVIYHSQPLVFEVVHQRGLYLHVSDKPYDTGPDPDDTSLPKRLQTSWTFECNLSPHYSTLVVHKYGRYDEDSARYLPAGTPFRLFHTQSDAFIQASCNPEKGESFATKMTRRKSTISNADMMAPLGGDNGDGGGGGAAPSTAQRRDDGDVCHCAYFRILGEVASSAGLGGGSSSMGGVALGGGGDGGSGRGRGGDKDPTNPANQSVKGLWSLELPRRDVSEPINWDTPVRLRHVGSGKYLAVSAPKPKHSCALPTPPTTECTSQLSPSSLLGAPLGVRPFFFPLPSGGGACRWTGRRQNPQRATRRPTCPRCGTGACWWMMPRTRATSAWTA